ncbi:transmembrane protein [Flexistipes sinusarabici DSM 4947]|uniref:Transmembrane protein n=1 Tax=Flexistipes sinusarabici (strain ATCC 49648 / DSM 4947 / MAS 10) TaxID=717231 RepID=F8E7S2_FLESM|nr:membrane protein [Flexistipes sinusarabici]AEI13917.1 transmembrane protein [Flexistipes sinusarabici DSM 4947]
MSEVESTEIIGETEKLRRLKTVINVVYILQAVYFVFGITLIIAVIIDYVKRGDAENTWMASHIKWQIRSFWYTVLWSVLGGILIPVGIGFVILAAANIWLIYRIVKGWLKLIDKEELYQKPELH